MRTRNGTKQLMWAFQMLIDHSGCRHRSRAARYIQTRWRKIPIDPISQERTFRPFRLVRYGNVHIYDARTLYDYIKASCDMHDPIARVAYDRIELFRLDALNSDRESIRHNFASLLQKKQDDAERESLWAALEREFVSLIDSSSANNDAHFSERILPQIVQCVDNMMVVNRTHTRRLVSSTFRNLDPVSANASVHAFLVMLHLTMS